MQGKAVCRENTATSTLICLPSSRNRDASLPFQLVVSTVPSSRWTEQPQSALCNSHTILLHAYNRAAPSCQLYIKSVQNTVCVCARTQPRHIKDTSTQLATAYAVPPHDGHACLFCIMLTCQMQTSLCTFTGGGAGWGKHGFTIPDGWFQKPIKTY